ncbi:MAG TPA: tRNA-guanine transglycosylase, partial [Puia sp.]|nr:tRNA-guanine transglycosylase [Puia sp.]
SPIDEGIGCETSQYYSKAYLRHLMKSKEILGLTIASVHNLAFYLHLVGEARRHIFEGDFAGWKREQVEILQTRL